MHCQGPQYQLNPPAATRAICSLCNLVTHLCQAWTPHLSCMTSVPPMAARAASRAPSTPPSEAAIWSRQLRATRCSSMGRSAPVLALQSACTLQAGQGRVRARQHMLQINRQASSHVGLKHALKAAVRRPWIQLVAQCTDGKKWHTCLPRARLSGVLWDTARCVKALHAACDPLPRWPGAADRQHPCLGTSCVGSCRDSASCTEALSAACTTIPFLEGSTFSRARTCEGMIVISGQNIGTCILCQAVHATWAALFCVSVDQCLKGSQGSKL